jgi:hypothetical protein
MEVLDGSGQRHSRSQAKRATFSRTARPVAGSLLLDEASETATTGPLGP